MRTAQRIVGACLGECIHVAGIINFLNMAKSMGYQTEFMGSAISVEDFVNAINDSRPDIAAVSYRLSPGSAEELLSDLKTELSRRKMSGIRFIFGGTPPVAEIAKATGIFEMVFSGQEPLEYVVRYLKQQSLTADELADTTGDHFAMTLVERIKQNEPFPLLRHHLGLETLEATVRNAHEIALSGELDILSIAPDQNAQEFFFRQKEMPAEGHGAGGVPLRKPDDLRAIYESTRCGNFPILRCYAGTRDLIRWAEMCVETIKMAWGAIPIFWYSELDKRSNRLLVEAIKENQATIRWYAEHGIPVEVNDSHQWSLRDAHDADAVATAYLAAYNAKSLGVKHYVSQYMLNTPPQTSWTMDLAKMLAKIEMIEGLHDDYFTSYRQIRTGLRSMVCEANRAKGLLIASITLGMLLQPHIIHVVGYCEADHAASSAEIIESCAMVRGAVNLVWGSSIDITHDPAIRKRKQQLVRDASLILEAIRSIGSNYEEPLTEPAVLATAVKSGILDAPHLYGSGVARGSIVTMPVNGAYVAINPKTGKVLSERKRLESLKGVKT